MLTTDDTIDDEYGLSDDEAPNKWYATGEADGAFGFKPQYLNEQYLQGWLAGILEILQTYPRDHHGKIQYASSAAVSDPLQWLWDAADELRAEWGLPTLHSTLTSEDEF